MKKLLLILINFLFCTFVNAQTSVYHPFPENNAIWNITAQGCCWIDCPSPPNPNPIIGDYNFSYSFSGDTIINGSTYRKILKTGTAYEHCNFGNFINNWYSIYEYAGAIRQDTAARKIYFISAANSNECLLYDFSVSVGDTINNCECQTTVASIDSVLIGSNYRKRFNLSTSPSISIIEGIGSTSGLLEPLCPFEYFGTLDCFSLNEQTLYPNSATDCILTTSIGYSENSPNRINIFPNPFFSQATLQTNIQLKNATLTINNCFGELVLSIKNINGNAVELSRGDLATGIYYLRLSQNNQTITTAKLVIVDN